MIDIARPFAREVRKTGELVPRTVLYPAWFFTKLMDGSVTTVKIDDYNTNKLLHCQFTIGLRWSDDQIPGMTILRHILVVFNRADSHNILTRQSLNELTRLVFEKYIGLFFDG